MKSIYLRNFVATATVVFVCFLLVSVSFVGIGRSFVISKYRDGMENSADEVARTASAIGTADSLGSWALGMSLSSIARSTGNHIFITDPQGVVLSCSDPSPACEHLGFRIAGVSMQSLYDTGELDLIGNLEGLYQGSRYVFAREINSRQQQVMGYVFVTCDIEEVLEAWSAFTTVAVVVAVVVLAVALVTSLIQSKIMARPLDEIAAASRKFARGDFSVRVRQVEDPSDEMGALIDSFNKMADSLENQGKRRSELVANISHELRTPMTTIAGFADGILDGTIPREDAEKYLISIRDETRRLSRLVREMLDVSRSSTVAADKSLYTDFDLTELVMQTLLSFEGRATKKGVDVDMQLPDNHLMVRANKDAITRVIYNLADNAVKFSTPGSCIVLRLYKENQRACVSIKNRGETIPPQDLPFIFDRFHKSDRSRSMDKDGVGLGLYLVREIINSHDEDIAVKSEAGWTEFVFTLRLSEK